MLPNEPARRPQEDTVLREVRQLLEQGRRGPALATLGPFATDEATSTRGLRAAATLFARVKAIGPALTAFRTLAQRYEQGGQLRLAAGALHQAFAFAKLLGTNVVISDVRADLVHVLERLGFDADARALVGQPEDDAVEVEDGDIIELTPLPPPSRIRLLRVQPSKEDIDSTIAEVDFFLEIGDVDEAREIAQTFLARAPHEPTLTAILDGLALLDEPLRRQA